MPKQGASSGFKYGRAVGAIEAAIALCSIPVEIVEPSVWKQFWRSAGQGQGRRAAAGPAAVSGRACGTRAQERPWPGRGIADRALRSQVMNAPLEPAHSPFGGSVAARVLRCPASSVSSRRCRRICARSSSLCRSRHGAACGDGAPDRTRSGSSTTSSARRSTTTRSRSTTSRTRCGRFSPMWRRCSTTPGAEYLPRTSRRLSDHRRRLRHGRPHRPHRQHDPRHRFQIWRRRARPRALSRRRRGRHQRAARCSTPRPRATRSPNSLPASTTSF